jgi:hypothetical protein
VYVCIWVRIYIHIYTSMPTHIPTRKTVNICTQILSLKRTVYYKGFSPSLVFRSSRNLHIVVAPFHHQGVLFSCRPISYGKNLTMFTSWKKALVSVFYDRKLNSCYHMQSYLI